MFQVHFLRHIGRPTGTTGSNDVLERYEKRLGRPTTGQKEALQRACKEILAVRTWPEFFARVQTQVPSKPKLISMLEGAITNSGRKGYHHRSRSSGGRGFAGGGSSAAWRGETGRRGGHGGRGRW